MLCELWFLTEYYLYIELSLSHKSGFKFDFNFSTLPAAQHNNSTARLEKTRFLCQIANLPQPHDTQIEKKGDEFTLYVFFSLFCKKNRENKFIKHSVSF